MAYARVNWEDSPSTNTPVNADNLNIMDAAIKSVSDATDITTTNPTIQTSYYPTFVTSSTKNQRKNDGLRYDTFEGTSSSVGRATLVLGNGTASGTAGNKQGRLALHNSSTGYTWLQNATSSSSFTQTLPALTGTVCVKQSATITTETNGWYKVDMGAFKLYYKSETLASELYVANTGYVKNINLPSGITFNSAKMCFAGNASSNASLLRNSVMCVNGATNFVISTLNALNQNITNSISYNVMLMDFS